MHAALVTNNEEWEGLCVKAGRSSGDLLQPCVYSPELHFSAYDSEVADMKNTVLVSEITRLTYCYPINLITP